MPKPSEKRIMDRDTFWSLDPCCNCCQDGCEDMDMDNCPLWASLPEAPTSRVVPPDPKRGEVGPQIVTDLSAPDELDVATPIETFMREVNGAHKKLLRGVERAVQSKHDDSQHKRLGAPYKDFVRNLDSAMEEMGKAFQPPDDPDVYKDGGEDNEDG